MKNAMKRIMSILLIAMLLISALPLAASATSTDPFAGFNAAPPAAETPVADEDIADEDVADEDVADEDVVDGQDNPFGNFLDGSLLPEEEQDDANLSMTGDGGSFKWEGGFANIEIHRVTDNGDGTNAGDYDGTTLIAAGSIISGKGPNSLSVREMLNEILGANWQKNYTFAEAMDSKEGKYTTNINDTFKEQKRTVSIGVYVVLKHDVTVHLMQTTADGSAHQIKAKTLTGLKTLNFNTLYDLIPPTDTNYAYRLASAGIVYNGKKLHSNQTAVPIVLNEAGDDYVTDVYIYLDVVDANSNAPVVYPIGSTGTGNGTTGNGLPSGGNNNGGNNNGGNNGGGTTGGNNNGGGTTGGNNGNMNEHLWNKVYLDVYMDNTVGPNPSKRIEITEGIAADYRVTYNEVENLLTNYYNAKSSKGIDVDGLYYKVGNWTIEFANANRKNKIENLDQLRQQGDVFIAVVLYNATLKGSSSSVADTSNPKTGDTIFAPIAVLGVSATALAAVMFFYNKKRMAQ